MNWQDIRTRYPHSWLVVEAFGAYTESGQRVIPHLELIAAFGGNWQAAWDRYKALHHADKQREYDMVRSDRETLDIGVLDSFRRPLQKGDLVR
jgi:hypothetical protein